MPIHDWSRVDAGLFHHFHLSWIVTLCQALNAGLLPPGFSALAEQVAAGPIPDVLTLHRPAHPTSPSGAAAGGAVTTAAPRSRYLVVDLLPPSVRDPQGIHGAIWNALGEEPFELPTDKRLTLAAYSAGLTIVAYVEPVAVGDPLPDMPLFLEPELYVPTPLEATYETTWSVCPAAFQDVVLGRSPSGDG
ncbi:MAG: hypothetical protein P4L84_24670 [Isosphaeraceae bacterium]|nr:hypothetical protein [Isosphaeraceae bacterium]